MKNFRITLAALSLIAWFLFFFYRTRDTYQDLVPPFFLLLALVFAWIGVYLYERRQNIILGCLMEVSFSTALIFMAVFISDCIFLKPLKESGILAIWGFFIPCAIVILGAIATRKILHEKPPGSKRWCLLIACRLMSLVGLYLCLLWLYKVVYSG